MPSRPSASGITTLFEIGAGGPFSLVQLPTVEKATWQPHMETNASKPAATRFTPEGPSGRGRRGR